MSELERLTKNLKESAEVIESLDREVKNANEWLDVAGEELLRQHREIAKLKADRDGLREIIKKINSGNVYTYDEITDLVFFHEKKMKELL